MGCERLWIGAESGSQRVLDAMKRRAEVADIQAKAHLLQSRGIQVGMFIMFGYEGEEIEDIEATVEHLKTANPDVFLTTVAYPIKGTPYYDAVEERLVSDLPWAQRTDRDIQVSGRRSRRFYQYATQWVVNEVNLHKARQAGSRDWLRLGKLSLNAQRGRLGMRLTQHQQERGVGAGRGWVAEERAADGW